MDTLKGYSSDSDAEESVISVTQQGSNKGTTTATRTEGSDQDDQDDQQNTFDPSDAFGLNSLETETPKDSAAIPRRPSKKQRNHESSSSSSLLPSTSTALTAVAAAPEVIDNTTSANALLIRPTDTTMHVNIPYKDMTAPMLGPQSPFASNSQRKLGAQQNTLSGHIEDDAISDFDFRNQQRTFDVYGYARNPSLLSGGGSIASMGVSNAGWVGDRNAATASGGVTAVEARASGARHKQASKDLKKKRNGQKGDTSIIEGEGAYVGPWGGWEGEKIHLEEGIGPTEDELLAAKQKSMMREQDKSEAAADRRQRELHEAGTEKSIFHGKSLHDYQGRTYMHIPADVDVDLHGEPGEQESYLPKSCIHTFTGHTKGISALRLLPKSGHLLLSASMDTKIKLWDVYHEGNCLRTFMGHSKAVRDICFSNDGRRFLSAGYDRQMKLWDTETGACIKAFSNGKIPYCVKFHPDPDKQHIFLAGMADKKIVQYDMNSGEVTQEYNQHLGSVNTITFVDENRRFVTTSDDKTMRAWDYDIPVVIKYIADPTMHSMPSVTVHPNKKWMACQSMDNQVLVFSSDTFKQNRKKVFKGHMVAGFACQVGFSPDGRFISSGDSEGNLVFWDWKSGRLLKRLQRAHKEPVIAHEWLPHETSKLVSGGWDGLIKLWD